VDCHTNQSFYAYAVHLEPNLESSLGGAEEVTETLLSKIKSGNISYLSIISAHLFPTTSPRWYHCILTFFYLVFTGRWSREQTLTEIATTCVVPKVSNGYATPIPQQAQRRGTDGAEAEKPSGDPEDVQPFEIPQERPSEEDEATIKIYLQREEELGIPKTHELPPITMTSISHAESTLTIFQKEQPPSFSCVGSEQSRESDDPITVTPKFQQPSKENDSNLSQKLAGTNHGADMARPWENASSLCVKKKCKKLGISKDDEYLFWLNDFIAFKQTEALRMIVREERPFTDSCFSLFIEILQKHHCCTRLKYLFLYGQKSITQIDVTPFTAIQTLAIFGCTELSKIFLGDAQGLERIIGFTSVSKAVFFCGPFNPQEGRWQKLFEGAKVGTVVCTRHEEKKSDDGGDAGKVYVPLPRWKKFFFLDYRET
jgi:hypothetical protein